MTSRDFKWGEMKRKGFKKEASAIAASKHELMDKELKKTPGLD